MEEQFGASATDLRRTLKVSLAEPLTTTITPAVSGRANPKNGDSLSDRVAVLSSTLTALYLNARSPSNVASAPGGGPTDTATPRTLAAFTVEENNYLRQAAVLQDLLDQQETALAPETVAQLKTSLRTIDEAILEARSALARDPSNKLLIEMLSANYKQKVDLLRRSTEITRGT